VNSGRPMPPQRVPTLTEVVEPVFRPLPAEAHVEPVPEPSFGSTAEHAAAHDRLAPHDPHSAHESHDSHDADDAHAGQARGPGEAHGIDENQLIERVLSDLQRQVELMLEYRLREVLTPALTRATEALMRDARVELASTLRDVVARAVAQELSRHRGR
jgi:hypothetical protein